MNRIVIASIAAGAVALSATSAWAGKKYSELKAKNLRKDEVAKYEPRMMELAKALDAASPSIALAEARADLKSAVESAKKYVQFGLGMDYVGISLDLANVEQMLRKQPAAV